MGTTGIAANLLSLGRTFHSRMKAKLNPTEDSMFSIQGQSKLAELIRMARIMLIDECTMLHKFQLEAMDRTLRDITSDERPFGGRILVLSGDYRQCLCVVPGASRAGVVATCLHKSHLWNQFEIMKLSVNMRVRASGDPDLEKFDRWTVSLGDGTAKTVGEEGLVEIPPEMCVPIKGNTDNDPEAETKSMQQFADLIYPNLQKSHTDPSVFVGRAILAPTNKRVDTINYVITKMMPGKVFPLYSSDVLDNPSDMFRYNTEYMNTLNPSGLPRHQLLLKPGIPLMLLRNLNPKNGLCNGTRLIFQSANNNLLVCTISGGQFDGNKVLIPRINLRPKDGTYAFEWSRRQFPVRISFAMTINKVSCKIGMFFETHINSCQAQGQSLKRVGVWLVDPVFAHGQVS
jgi:hypothetical protein